MYVIELVLCINVLCGMYVYVRLWKCMAYYHIIIIVIYIKHIASCTPAGCVNTHRVWLLDSAQVLSCA